MFSNFLQKFKPLIKYATVGIIGTAIDIGSLYLFVEYAGIPVIPASVLSFLLAVVNNFVLNKAWTFQNKSKNYRKLFIKFLIVSIVGLLLTVLCMYLFVNIAHIWYIFAKALTSLIVLSWNFLGNKFWTFNIHQRENQLLEDAVYDLSIIIPAYNEENRIKNTLLAINDYLSDRKISAEIIVVNDGSNDKTTEVVNSYQNKIPNLKLINLSKNYGKGAAVKRGIIESKGEMIFFTDADNSTPIDELEKLQKSLTANNAQIAIGSRYLQDSSVKIKQPKYRIFLGRAGNLLIRAFLIDNIRDTQCGFKLFTRDAAKNIFQFQKVKRFGFDMEALVIAGHLGYKIVEVPVSWFNSAESRVRPIKDALITLKDLVYIKLNIWSGRYND